MATKNENQNQEKKSVKFRNAMKCVGKFCLTLMTWCGKGLLAFYLLLALIFLWAVTIVFLNPLFLYILGLMFPKWTVEETHRWCRTFDDFFMEDYWLFACKVVFENLPWYARKHYLKYAIGFSFVKTEDQLKWFAEMTDKEKEDNVQELKDEAWETVWEKEPKMRPFMVGGRRSISREKFESIINPLDRETLDAYISKHGTLSAAFLVIIRDRLDAWCRKGVDMEDKNSDFRFLLNTLANHVATNGAPAEVLNGLGGCIPIVFNCVKDALDVYSARQIVCTTKKSEDLANWEKYCQFLAAKKQMMPAKAQIFMDSRQYEIYHAAGLSLDKQAIIYFISKGGNLQSVITDRIFEYEEIVMDQDMEMALHNSPVLYQLYANIEAKRAKSSTL